MQKLRFFFLLMLLPSLLFAQQRTQIVLQRFEIINVDNKTKITHLKKPIFEHDGAILTCDSARLWSELNYFEAFGNVHINQGDTINIYSNELNYDGNQKMAHLMNNVRMSDPSTTLTTNVFDYNMATKIGRYIQNGKIVSKEAQIVSKNGHYFSNTRDAYFRYNVVVTTDQVTIKGDTLRYNTFTNQTYFYGPTNIKGKDDNLYTENGEYNTKTEDAFFGKKNLYTQGTKTLKGDSLYYKGKIGYGRAVKNITFNDSEDKLLLKGQLGEYYKKDERIVVTKNAYVGIGTADTITLNDKQVPDTLWVGSDTLQAQMVLQKSLKLIPKPVVLADDEIGAEDEKTKDADEKAKALLQKQTQDALKSAGASTQPPIKPAQKENKKLSKKEKEREEKEQKEKDLALKDKIVTPPKPPDTTKLALDTLKKTADSLKLDPKKVLKTDSITKTAIKSSAKDTLKAVVKTSPPALLAKPIDKNISGSTKTNIPTTKITVVKDSAAFNPADTVRTRIIKAFHNVRVYKSNLQAKSDSLFFTAADSTLRWYQNPIIWSDKSQQTGDTIYVQFKNKKINSFQVLQNAFTVNAETDTTKFNQIKGKLNTGFFVDGEIKNMYIDGNAESIYYTKDDQEKYTNINQTVSARIRVIFENKELSRVKTVKQVEGAFTPIDKAPKESLLTGFIWKPSLRPKSKEDIIKGSGSNTSQKPKENKPKTSTKPPIKQSSNKKTTKAPIKVAVPQKKTTIKLDTNKVIAPDKILVNPDTNKLINKPKN